MAPGSAHPYCRCLFYSSNALARATTRVAEEAFAPTGLAPSAAYVLLTTLREPGASPGHIADVMKLDRSTVTRLIEQLEKRGLARRRSQGRTVAVTPTRVALALEPTLTGCARQAFQRFRTRLGPDLPRFTSQVFEAAVAMEGTPGGR